MTKIKVAGLGDLYDEDCFAKHFIKELEEQIKTNNVEMYPTYYDFELKGERDSVLKVFGNIWGLDSEELLEENGFTIIKVEDEE